MSCSTFNYNGCFAVPVGRVFETSLTDLGDDNQETNLTGFDFLMTIQDNKTGADLLILSVVGDDQTTGIYIPEPKSGEILIQIRPAESISLGAGDYKYNISIIDPSLNNRLFTYGNISFIGIG